MPILFTVFFGLIFGPVLNSATSKSDPRLPVGGSTRTRTGCSAPAWNRCWPISDVIRPVVIEGNEADQASERVAKGELAAVLRMPAGYSQAVTSGQNASLEVIADQSTPAGRTAVTALDTITGRLLGAVESAHLSVQVYQDQVGFKDEASRQAYFQESFQDAVSAWNNHRSPFRSSRRPGRLLPPARA